MHGSIEYRYAVAAIIDLLRVEINEPSTVWVPSGDASANGRQQRMPSFMRFPPFSLSSSVDESASLIHRKNKNLELLIFFVFLLLSWLSSIAKAVVVCVLYEPIQC